MALATTMYHSRKNPLKKVSADSESVETARSGKVRKLHKAFLRWHDPENWPTLREGLIHMGRGDLIGNGPHCLVPRQQPARVVAAGAPASAAAARRPSADKRPAKHPANARPERKGCNSAAKRARGQDR